MDKLIKKKATGSPKDLSLRMGISERQVYNIINEMKELGAPIYFCTIRRSYCYKERVTFTFGFEKSGIDRSGRKANIILDL
ncbi:hypothetical protein [Fulvivirga imtechensis]|nr:hypothetical protein [Fulvivirga imtechensis]